MNFPFYIARRYLFSKKKHNAINIISGVSVCGVALATLALVCTLSVFNGFQDMVASFFTAFDPQLKITVREGKVFDGQNEKIRAVCALPEVSVSTETLEENAMVQYKDRQAMVVLKGVEDNFEDLTEIDSILYGAGEFILHDSIVNYGVMGVELVSTLGTGLAFVDPLQVYLPKRNAKVNMANPGASFNRDYLYSPGVVFVVNQQKYDESYILTSLDFLRNLLDYTTEVSGIELKLKPNANVSSVQSKIEKMLGDDFVVQNRYQQQADVFRIMEIEKLISYLFLTFILMIACFNVIGSLSMLILDKKDDVITLRSLGASDKLISRIFLFDWSHFRYYSGFDIMFHPAEVWSDYPWRRGWYFCGRCLSGECPSVGCGTYFHYSVGSRILVCMVSGSLFKQALYLKKTAIPWERR